MSMKKPEAVALFISVPVLIVGALALSLLGVPLEQVELSPQGTITVSEKVFVAGTGKTEAAILAYGADPLQDMEIYYRENQQHAPIVFLVHGGSEDQGDRVRMRKSAPLFTDPGFTVVMPNYRYGDPGTFLSSYDVACSIATFSTHAEEYGADMNNIIVMGFSHGGWVSSLTVYDNDRDWLSECDEKEWPGVDGFIGVATTFGAPRSEQLWESLGIRDLSDLESRYNDISGVRDGAINYINEGDVPAFLAHGTADLKFNELRVEDFGKVLERAGVGAEVHVVEGGTHTTGLLEDRIVFPALVKFVKNIFELEK